MKPFLLTLLLCILSLTAFAQEDEKNVVPTLPDEVMEQVVRRLATYYFKPARRSRVIYFSNENVRSEWLPKIRNVRFVVLESGKIPSGTMGYVFSIEDKKNDLYTIGFGYGEIGCNGGGAGVTWSVRLQKNGLTLWPNKNGGFGWTCHEYP